MKVEMVGGPMDGQVVEFDKDFVMDCIQKECPLRIPRPAEKPMWSRDGGRVTSPAAREIYHYQPVGALRRDRVNPRGFVGPIIKNNGLVFAKFCKYGEGN